MIGQSLLPMADCINFADFGPQTRLMQTKLTFDDDGNKRSLLGRAISYVREGEQIFGSFGVDNTAYLVYHGIALQSNSHDTVRISLRSVPKHKKIQSTLLAKAGVKKFYSLTPQNFAPSIMMAHLRILALYDKEMRHHRHHDFVNEPISRNNELRSLRMLVRSLKKSAKAYHTPKGALSQSASSVEKYVRIYKFSQHKLIRDTIDAVELFIKEKFPRKNHRRTEL